MNFSAFGGPFSGIHQFAAKFGHDTQAPPGAFSTPGINNTIADNNHVQRYQTNGNHFNQPAPNGKAIIYEIFKIKIQFIVKLNFTLTLIDYFLCVLYVSVCMCMSFFFFCNTRT